MKKIVVMSDNHGQHDMLEYVKEKEPQADYYVHCGDSEAAYKEMLTGYICVKGNNDWSLDLPMEARFEVEGIPILITHGQYFGYFNRELAMNDLLTRNQCRVLLCGHTHTPMFLQDGNYYYIILVRLLCLVGVAKEVMQWLQLMVKKLVVNLKKSSKCSIFFNAVYGKI